MSSGGLDGSTALGAGMAGREGPGSPSPRGVSQLGAHLIGHIHSPLPGGEQPLRSDLGSLADLQRGLDQETGRDYDTMRDLALKFRRLLQASYHISLSLDQDDAIRAIMDETCDILRVESASVWIVDRVRDEVYTRVGSCAPGLPTNRAVLRLAWPEVPRTMVWLTPPAHRVLQMAADNYTIRMPSTKGIVGYVASTGQAVHVGDAYGDSRFDPSGDEQSGFRTRNLLTLPIHALKGDEVTAVMQVLPPPSLRRQPCAVAAAHRLRAADVHQAVNKKGGVPFTRSDQLLFTLLAAQAGVVLQHAHFQHSMKVRHTVPCPSPSAGAASPQRRFRLARAARPTWAASSTRCLPSALT